MVWDHASEYSDFQSKRAEGREGAVSIVKKTIMENMVLKKEGG